MGSRVSRDWWAWLGIARTHGAPILRLSPKEQVRRGAWSLSPEDRKQGFIRPLRFTYTHIACGRDTAMGEGSARLWAKAPQHSDVTWCARCQIERPVREFVWLGSSEHVGD